MKCKDVVFTLAVPVPGASANGEFKDRIVHMAEQGPKYQLELANDGVWGKGPDAETWDFYPNGIIKRVGGVVREKQK